jgi:hypothetical protein
MVAFPLLANSQSKLTTVVAPLFLVSVTVTPLREWLKEVVDAETKQQILWCTQHSGDVLFVPGMYAHGVVNQKKVLGVATEMLSRHGEDLMGA